MEAGYPLTGASDHLVSEALYLDDPDGNGIEIYRDRPREEWPMADGHVRMSNAPLDLEGLLREAAGAPANGLDPATCIGHIHLHVGDLAAAREFYVGVLGFDVMQQWGGAALFESAGGYHHHIGLNTWAGVGASPPPPGAAGLRAYAVVLPDEEARAAVLERLEAAGVETAHGEAGVALSDPWGNGILLQTARQAADSGTAVFSPGQGG